MTNDICLSHSTDPFEAIDFKLLAEPLHKAYVEQGKPSNVVAANVDGLYEVFLDTLPESARQNYNCSCCRRFVSTIGKLVMIDDNRQVKSLYWNPEVVPEIFKPGIQALKNAVEYAVSYRFPKAAHLSFKGYESTTTIENHVWNHFYVSELPSSKSDITEANTKYALLVNNISRFSTGESLRRALKMVNSMPFNRKEQTIAILQWLHQTYDTLYELTGSERRLFMFKSAFEAPNGALNLGSTSIGSLITNIERGISAEDCMAIFNSITRPEVYMRPTEVASETEIEAAIKAIDALGYGKSLERRPAHIEDIPDSYKVWSQEVELEDEVSHGDNPMRKLLDKSKEIEVFGSPDGKITELTMSALFKMLPEVKRLAIPSFARGHEIKLTELAVNKHPDAKPILYQADPTQVNEVSYWTTADRVPARHWFREVPVVEIRILNIITIPTLTPGGTDMLFFQLEGAHFQNSTHNPLFPEIITRELLPYRRAIETFNQNTPLKPDPKALAGISFSTGSTSVPILVETSDTKTWYRLVYVDTVKP